MRENDNLREILQRFSIEFSRREKEKEKEREKEKEWEKEKEKEEEDERKLVEGGVKFERKEGTEGGGGGREWAWGRSGGRAGWKQRWRTSGSVLRSIFLTAIE